MGLPPSLYHGTRVAHWPDIANAGLVPRQISGNSRWVHSVESREDAVYLSTAYPLHFALHAADGGDVLLVEIATCALDPNALIADEDALAFAQPQHGDLAMRTKYFRERSHLYPASSSLTSMGTCAHRGTIASSAITRTARFSTEDASALVFGGIDPVVSPLHYAIFAQEFEQSVRWLFGDEPTCLLNPRLSRPVIEVVDRRSRR